MCEYFGMQLWTIASMDHQIQTVRESAESRRDRNLWHESGEVIFTGLKYDPNASYLFLLFMVTFHFIALWMSQVWKAKCRCAQRYLLLKIVNKLLLILSSE